MKCNRAIQACTYYTRMTGNINTLSLSLLLCTDWNRPRKYDSVGRYNATLLCAGESIGNWLQQFVTQHFCRWPRGSRPPFITIRRGFHLARRTFKL